MEKKRILEVVEKMKRYPILFEKVIYPLIEVRKPEKERILPYLHFLRRTQWWSLELLKALQLKRLHSLLSHAYSNVPYYRKIFNKLKLTPNNIKTVKDLAKLPVLTKADIRNNINDMIAKNYEKKELLLSSTGGSTGEPLQFYTNKVASAWNMAVAYRAWEWAGYNIGDKIAYIWGAPQDISLHGSLKEKIYDRLFRLKMLDAFNITYHTLDKFIEEMRRFKPKVINAYPSAVDIVAKYLLENRKEADISPKAVLTSAEMLYPYQKKNIEKAFGCPTFDYYSGRETSLHATECSYHAGYHTSIETAVVEFIKDGQPVAPVELGEIVLTDLTNYAMPFIRYKIGDIGISSTRKCPCGRNLPLIEKVIGRTTDLIVKKDKGYVAGPALTLVVKKLHGIKQCQIIQEDLDNLTIKMVKGKEYSKKEIDYFLAEIKKFVGNMNIKVVYVDTIPKERSGKFRFTISKVSTKF